MSSGETAGTHLHSERRRCCCRLLQPSLPVLCIVTGQSQCITVSQESHFEWEEAQLTSNSSQSCTEASGACPQMELSEQLLVTCCSIASLVHCAPSVCVCVRVCAIVITTSTTAGLWRARERLCHLCAHTFFVREKKIRLSMPACVAAIEECSMEGGGVGVSSF